MSVGQSAQQLPRVYWRNVVFETEKSQPRRGRYGFSLLEVIIATAILAASAVMLMSMFSMGERHTARADERTIAQRLCQSKLDELLADSSQLLPVKADIIPQYPGWVWSLDVQPTALEGFVQLRVSVTRIPGMATGADLDLATKVDEAEAPAVETLPTEPTYSLTRWIQFEGNVAGMPQNRVSGTGNSSLDSLVPGGLR